MEYKIKQTHTDFWLSKASFYRKIKEGGILQIKDKNWKSLWYVDIHNIFDMLDILKNSIKK